MKNKHSEHQEVLEAIEYAVAKTDQEEAREKARNKKKDNYRILAAKTTAKAQQSPAAGNGVGIILLLGMIASIGFFIVWKLLGLFP